MATNPTNPPATTTTNPTVNIQDTTEEEVKKVFKHIDSDGDGKLSPTELSDVMTSLGRSHNSPEELSLAISDFDTDKDGFINQQEFTNFCNNNNDDIKQLKNAFDLYDGDKNGFISAAELHLVLTRLGESRSMEECVKMISAVDSDGDGNVNFEEFKKMMTCKKTSDE